MQVILLPSKGQTDAIKFLASQPYGFANYHTGSGKSLIGILISFYLLKNKKVNKSIITAPKSGLISLYEDFEDNTDYLPVIIESFTELLQFLESDKEIAIANYNILEQCIEFKKIKGTIKEEISENILNYFIQNKICVIHDEFHTLKEPKSQVTKRWKLLRPYISNCYGLTASSYFKNLEDIYQLCAYLDKKFFGTLTSFRDTYTIYEMKKLYSLNRSIPITTGYKNLDLLKFNLDKIMISYTPELDVRYLTQDINIKDLSEYKKVAEGLLKLIETGRFADDGSPEKALQKKQWSARLPDLQRIVNNSIEKQKIFSDLVLQLKEQGFIVYCNLLESIDLVKSILDMHKVEYKEITGAVKTKDRKKYKKWFNENPANKCFIISDAGGQSLNLQVVNNLVLYEFPQGIGRFIQVRGRIVREFSKHKYFNIHLLITKGTIDEYKYIRITQQQQIYNDIFGLAVAPDEAEFQEFNQFLLDSFKKEYLWKK